VLDDRFIEDVRGALPELPDAKATRFVLEFGLSNYDAGVLTASRDLADQYEKLVTYGSPPKLSANWLTGELAAHLNRENLDISESKVDIERFAGLLKRIEDDTISSATAKIVLTEMWEGGQDADTIIETRGLRQITDTAEIEQIIAGVMAANPRQLADYRAGKDKLFGFFVGQVMKATAGKANPAQVNELLKRMLRGP
jgi:aspartyl-tRNA(Asn)/glutamyl-tRNA(Gln) amidotransferase subunit B